MLNYLFGEHDRVVAFVAGRLPDCELGFGNCVTMGVLRGRELIAGLIYHNWRPAAGSIEISGAASDPRWLTRQSLALMHYYPFTDIHAQQVVMQLDAENERLQRQLASIGYKFILFPRMYGRERDGVIARLTYEAWAANRIMRRVSRGLPDMPPQQEAA